MELVRSITQVVRNAEEFSRLDAQSASVALERFSQFFHWYYFSHIDTFAPSKFIGYADTTLEDYSGEGTGTDTQACLAKWFRKVEPGDEQYDELAKKLRSYASKLGKSISRRTFQAALPTTAELSR
ncbi:hypothetical protein HH1059_11150 [Halorhodospira halochloris]|uniref:Uncharacterized protein n=1 Tax=Halorhodospira halochloris TaxID=1052 RepID=A0A2Z6EZH6_HALHR|nr:hypothetical protein [Halorhodospira halochloris]BBE11042.1 hypothetical protein HH1059_11150 [Halorhodospira halochloris]